jgi:hypothetical protein
MTRLRMVVVAWGVKKNYRVKKIRKTNQFSGLKKCTTSISYCLLPELVPE